MNLYKNNLSDEQLSDLMKCQRRKGADRLFGYVFISGLLAAVITPFLREHLGSGDVLFATTLVVCGAGFAVVTSN